MRSNPVFWELLMLDIAAKVLRLNFNFVLAGLFLLALACSQATSPPASSEPIATPGQTQSSETTVVSQSESDDSPRPATAGGLTRESLRVPTEPPPDLDTSIASVPLEEVIFDTFDGGAIALSSASKSTIERLRDLIKPVYIPKYDPIEGGDWLRDTDMVIGYASQSGEAFALGYHNAQLLFRVLVEVTCQAKSVTSSSDESTNGCV